MTSTPVALASSLSNAHVNNFNTLELVTFVFCFMFKATFESKPCLMANAWQVHGKHMANTWQQLVLQAPSMAKTWQTTF